MSNFYHFAGNRLSDLILTKKTESQYLIVSELSICPFQSSFLIFEPIF